MQCAKLRPPGWSFFRHDTSSSCIGRRQQVNIVLDEWVWIWKLARTDGLHGVVEGVLMRWIQTSTPSRVCMQHWTKNKTKKYTEMYGKVMSCYRTTRGHKFKPHYPVLRYYDSLLLFLYQPHRVTWRTKIDVTCRKLKNDHFCDR